VRILALLAVLIAVASVSCVTATALGRDDISNPSPPQFGEDVPQLLPMTAAEPATTGPASVSRSGVHELAVIAAAYWLVLGGVALRRSSRAGIS
jgi:hypothetical protein